MAYKNSSPPPPLNHTFLRKSPSLRLPRVVRPAVKATIANQRSVRREHEGHLEPRAGHVGAQPGLLFQEPLPVGPRERLPILVAGHLGPGAVAAEGVQVRG